MPNKNDTPNAPANAPNAPNALPFRKRLRMYSKLEASTTVCVSFEGVVTLPDGTEAVFNLPDEYPFEHELDALARAKGRTGWCADTLAEACQAERGKRVEAPPADPTPPAEPEPNGDGKGLP